MRCGLRPYFGAPQFSGGVLCSQLRVRFGGWAEKSATFRSHRGTTAMQYGLAITGGAAPEERTFTFTRSRPCSRHTRSIRTAH